MNLKQNKKDKIIKNRDSKIQQLWINKGSKFTKKNYYR